MRDYQRQKNNKYILPPAVYHQTLWTIRDYYRLKEQADSLITESSAPDGQPKGSGIGDPVAAKAIQREKKMNIVFAIDHARKAIPKEYQEGVWNNVVFRCPFPMDADRTTYGRYKSMFVYSVAEELNLL